MKLLSVIIPIYNTEKYLKQCLSSILESTYPNLEIICINDGSTDKSLEILQEYSKIDERIKIINKENGGPQEAREKGYEICQGEYITNIDSDDWLEKDTFELAIKMLEIEKLDTVLYDAYFWYHESSNGEKRINKVNNKIILGKEAFIYSLNWSIGGLGIFKRDILLKSIQSKKLYNGDEVITRKIFLNSNKIGLCDGKYYYRQNNYSLTRVKEFNFKSIETILSNLELINMININNLNGEEIDNFRIEVIKDILKKMKLLLKNRKRLQNKIKEGKKVINYGLRNYEHKKLIKYLLKNGKTINLIKYYRKIFYYYIRLKLV